MSDKYQCADNMPCQSDMSDAKGSKDLSDPGKDGKGIDKSSRDKDSISLKDSSSKMAESSNSSKLSSR